MQHLPPANKVCEGYVFTGVCGSLSGGGGSLARGVSVQEVSVQGGGVSAQVGLCQGVRENPVRLRADGTHPT